MFSSKAKRKLLLLTLLNSLFLINAESFRVQETIIIPIQNNSDSQVYEVGINDAIVVMLPKDLTFVQGIEIFFDIPSPIADHRNTIVYNLYKNISPVPTKPRIDYTGEEIAMGLFSGQLSLNVQIPIKEENTIKKTPYTHKITSIPDFTRGFIFLRLQLAMKGVPSSVINAKFKVTVKPILIEKGKLKIKPTFQNSNGALPFTAIIDEKTVTLDKDNSILLKPGAHSITLMCDNYRNESRTVMIEQASETTLPITFTGTQPIVKLVMPSHTIVFCDGEQCSVISNSISLTPGVHELKFVVGDYEIIKNVQIQEGVNYTISLSMDANVIEEN